MTGVKGRQVGRYQILGEIGRGRTGVVYKAKDPNIERIVALKVIHTEAFPDPDILRECLKREAKLVGKLCHPNIVVIHDADEEEGNPFIVTEYLEGPTLEESIELGVSQHQAVDFALQLCDALGYAHEQGIVHGDLKPSNIKVLGNLEVKVTDFGLSRSIQESDAEGKFTGTFTYASPEQLRGYPIDGRSDIFSLGVVLFEMLTGMRPFECNALGMEEPIQEKLCRISSEFLRNVLQRALTLDPGQRYQTCAALGYDLKRYQSGDTSVVKGNPFIFGPPITEPQWFYGRNREIQIITSRLRSDTPGSSAIIGGRRIGKSSLLNRLSHPSAAQEYGFSDEYLFIHLSPFYASSVVGAETQFWQLILRGILEKTSPRLPPGSRLIEAIEETLAQTPITFNDFKSVVAETRKQGYKIALLFDEFQLVVGHEAFQRDFFGGLRDLVQRYNLAFVTESGKNLQALAKTEEVAVSPFWNVFANVYLGPLAKEEARELIAGYTEGTDISFTAEDFGYVMRLSGGHPYFLQLACWHVFDAYREGKWREDTAQEQAERSIKEEFFRQAEPHFVYYWEQSSDPEQRGLIILAYRNRRNGDYQPVRMALRPGPGLKALSERSLVIKTEVGQYELFSPCFAEWIRQHVEAYYDGELVPHFQHFWRHTENGERRALAVLARLGQRRRGFSALVAGLQYRRLVAQYEHVLQDLVRRGLVIRTDDGTYDVLAPLFSKWILSQPNGEIR